MNYKNLMQNEICQAFFGHQQFTLFTCCACFIENDQTKCKNIVLVTPENTHSRMVVFYLCNMIIEIMNNCVSYPITKVKFWSDACTSQFRSQFVFWLLTKYPLCMDIAWSYFQAYHGKGAVGGLGGTVKWRVLQKVNANKVVINWTKGFCKICK